MIKVDIIPQVDKTNGWAAILPTRRPKASLQGTLKFDWLIVGAGYAGLMAARRLAEHHPGDSIALVEAGEVGQNASGRNAGFAIDLPHLVEEGALTVAQAHQEIRLLRGGIDMLRTVVLSKGIACHWSERGRYHAAASASGVRELLDPVVRELKRWDEPHEVLSRAELSRRLGTNHYAGAIFTPGSILMNPAALSCGLADTLPDNVTLFENSPVIAHDLNGPVPSVRTPDGGITAGRAILTVNIFASQFGLLGHRQLPIMLLASLTAPLNAKQRAALGSEDQWGITPANGAVGPTVRLTADGRLLLRHGFDYSPSLRCGEFVRLKARRSHHELLMNRFPQLENVMLEHTWMGWLSLASNHQPIFGHCGNRLYTVACCNGVGVARHTAAGSAIADLASGIDSEALRIYRTYGRAARLPPRPLLDLGVHARLKWERYAGRQER